MIEQTRLVIIDAADQTKRFRVNIHRAESPAEQLVEPAFYQKFAKRVHEGTHYEIELVESPVWGRLSPDVPIHIHQNPGTKLNFVCFAGNIATLDDALLVLRTWCVGTVYTMTHNEDFGPVAREAGANFIEVMRGNFGIVISGDMEMPKPTTTTLKAVDDGGPFLADFLARELEGFATLDGKTINPSTAKCVAEGEENFGLDIHRNPPQSVTQLAAWFYRQLGFEIVLRLGRLVDGIQLKRSGRIVKIVVITKRCDGSHAEISVRLIS